MTDEGIFQFTSENFWHCKFDDLKFEIVRQIQEHYGKSFFVCTSWMRCYVANRKVQYWEYLIPVHCSPPEFRVAVEVRLVWWPHWFPLRSPVPQATLVYSGPSRATKPSDRKRRTRDSTLQQRSRGCKLKRPRHA